MTKGQFISWIAIVSRFPKSHYPTHQLQHGQFREKKHALLYLVGQRTFRRFRDPDGKVRARCQIAKSSLNTIL